MHVANSHTELEETTLEMSDAKLLAVIEVPRDDRVRCQSAGCNHPVFRRIHVVRENSVVRVYGSECFKKLFIGLPVASSMPQYTSSDGRHLTEEERQLLIENTETLIQLFESEYQAELARKAALEAARPAPAQTKPLPLQPTTSTRPAVQHISEAKAKQIVRAKYNVDPDLPGWRGLVLSEMERIDHAG
jgi:hypothetical protein